MYQLLIAAMTYTFMLVICSIAGISGSVYSSKDHFHVSKRYIVPHPPSCVGVGLVNSLNSDFLVYAIFQAWSYIYVVM